MSISTFKRITWKTACEEYKIREHLNQTPTEYNPKLENCNCVAVFEGDVHLKDLPFDADYCNFSTLEDDDDQNILVIIVNGNLTVDTYISVESFAYPAMIWVRGNLKAENIFLDQLGEIVVNGNVDLGYSFFTTETRGGQFICKGNLTTQYGYIAFYEGMMRTFGETKGKIYCNDEFEKWGEVPDAFIRIDSACYLADEDYELLKKDGEIINIFEDSLKEPSAVIPLIREGRKMFKELDIEFQ